MSAPAGLRLKGVALISLLAFWVLPSAAGAAQAGPRWHVTTGAFPTVLAEGSAPKAGTQSAKESLPMYNVSVRNVGAGEATTPIAVTVSLPAGITVDPSLPSELIQFNDGEGAATVENCEAPAPDRVECQFKRGVASGGNIRVFVALQVATDITTPAVAEVQVSGGGVAPASVSEALTVTADGAEAPFEFLSGAHGLVGEAVAESGGDAVLAGSHPFSVPLEANFTSRAVRPVGITGSGYGWPVEPPKDISFTLPRGFVVNPQAPTRLCTERELVSQSEGLIGTLGCPAASQVGGITVTTNLTGVSEIGMPLYALEPPLGVAAEFGFNILGTVVHVQGGVDGKFHLAAGSSDILAKYAVLGIQAYLWGNPADPRHDASRRGKGGCGSAGCGLEPGEANTAPLITMPTSCGEPLALSATANSWIGSSAAAESAFLDTNGEPLEMEGCNALAFEPTIESKATTDASESPSGLGFAIHQPQNESLEGRSTAALKNAQVTLPQGVTLNASAANGLGSCTEEQMGYAPAEGKIHFSTAPQTCPNSAKVGTLTVTTPLLGHKLPGSIYVAKPFDNPFGSLLAIYLAVEDEESGIVSKLAGSVSPDPTTGQLTATFEENPQLPLSDIQLEFFGGSNAALTSPLTCGTHTTTSTLTPWSTPEGVDVHPSDSFETTVPASGSGSCPASEAEAPAEASFSAGTESPLSGAFSSFVLRVARKDGTQHITGVETTLPEGLLGRLAGIPYCSEAAIAQAISREHAEQGKLEQQSPSCPAASEVGTVQVTAGSGSTPIPVSGHAYLAGPYKGAPLSLAVIVPAVAGPFDLGTVVDRVALNLGEYDARIRAVADPLPTIREGIPLDVRSIELKLDRSSFTLNPTSCEEKAIEGQLTTQAGQSLALGNRFQVGECGRLKFKPKLKLALHGGTRRTKHPALKSVLTFPSKGQYANVAKAAVTLPASEFIDQAHVGNPCTRPEFAAETCPKISILGTAKLWSPLLDQPLAGKVYFRSNGGERLLPDIVADLRGQVHVILVGYVDSVRKKGSEVSRIRTTFAQVPDAPASKFVLELKGGKEGVLVNSGNLCKVPDKASVRLTAQNGKTYNTRPAVANDCKGGKKKKGK